MDKEIEIKVKQFVTQVAKNYPNFTGAYLFGSYSKNTQKEDSDIDIAIVMNNLPKKDKFDLQVQLLLLASDFDSRIEPHPFSQKDFDSLNPFTSEIRKTGVALSA